MYFVLALALFPQLGCTRVWTKLCAGLTGLVVACPSEKALRDLRRRLGPAPLKVLFEVVAGPVGQPRTAGVCFAGMRTVAFDGLNSLKVPDSEGNRSWLGHIRYHIGWAGYPNLRLLCLVETGTCALLGATIGGGFGEPGARDETNLAHRLLPLLGSGMWVLVDRGFDTRSRPALPRPSGARAGGLGDVDALPVSQSASTSGSLPSQQRPGTTTGPRRVHGPVAKLRRGPLLIGIGR